MIFLLRSSFLALLALTPILSLAQLEGLWLVEKVTVGSETMTPQAKWFRIHPDGTYQSGNGWLQNSEGIYTYDEKSNIYTPEEKNGIEHPYGGFSVSLAQDHMTWFRMEDGQEVTVFLTQIEALPKGTADQAKGLWKNTTPVKDQTQLNETSLQEIETLFLRWDRVFVGQTKKDRITGYWVMHGHRPEIGLIYHNEKLPREYWNVTFSGTIMRWEHSGTDAIFTFERTTTRP